MRELLGSIVVAILLGGGLVWWRYHLNGHLVVTNQKLDASLHRMNGAVTELEATTSDVIERSRLRTDGNRSGSGNTTGNTIIQACDAA